MKRKLRFEQRFLLLALLTGVPAMGLGIAIVLTDPSPAVYWLSIVIYFAIWIGTVLALRNQVVRPLQTIANLLSALREEDFSTRASGACENDALGEVFLEINTLSQLLQEQRLGALEATALLRTVMEEIDVAVFAFDPQHKLQLINRAGQKLLGQPAERLLARTAADLNLAGCLEGESPRTIQSTFPGGLGRWSMRRGTFWQNGTQRHLLVMADLSRALREEERQAWQRMVRVLGHEINNSLAPIKSISGSLSHLLSKQPLPPDWNDDARRGLDIIASRSEALGRFMATYTRLAKLPPPQLRKFEVTPWLRKVIASETRMAITINPGPAVTLEADSDQLEQLLINLLRNAVDAALQPKNSETPSSEKPEVSVEWQLAGKQLEIRIIDNGPGLSNTANLFVPFFTTKPGGSGIGLVLSRQIAEAHGGSLILENRSNTHGCCARLVLPK